MPRIWRQISREKSPSAGKTGILKGNDGERLALTHVLLAIEVLSIAGLATGT